ncbi:MAG: glycine cleavage system aminomethyltransferase GcvT [Gammaproteobacteria bacterium]|nr:glycine cleavage system aminomethyltransferase GcvT [Gammaproteobacteria bacterium]
MQATVLAEREEPELARTALHELHAELGAKLVPFAGFSMPLNYPGGILAEHRHTRSHASLFDVSHMNRMRVTGLHAAEVLESLCPANLVSLPPGLFRYTVLTNDDGGIIDDLIIRRRDNDFEIVANGATRETVLYWLNERIGDECRIQVLDEFALLALQGPRAAEALASLQPCIHDLTFMRHAALMLAGKFCLVARCGYTGEDGFEISVPVEHALTLARQLLNHEAVAPAGLGARDGLRLEAGLCLYGQDLDATTSPVEAGLGWMIPRARRPGGERAGGFPGSARIFAELEAGPWRRLTGLLPDSRAPLRAGTLLYDSDGNEAGKVTSGAHSPELGHPIAMGYVKTDHLYGGGDLKASQRNRTIDVRTTNLPFVPHRYVR